MTINRPGIEVQISSQTGSVRALAAPTTYFSTGYAQWGPVNTATFVSDKRELYTAFGAAVPGQYLVSDAIHYFDTSNGSGRAWLVRSFEFGVDSVSGNAKTATDYTAKAVLNASATPALTVSATYPGAIGNNFKVDVITDVNNIKKVIVWGRNTPIVITWGAVQAKVQAQIDAVNANAAANLSDFKLSIPGAFSAVGPDVTSVNARTLSAPSVSAIPLIGGGDGDTANFPMSVLLGGIDPVTYKATGLEVLNDTQYGPGSVSIPGYTPTLALTAALDLHARANDRLGLVSLRPNGTAVVRATDAVNTKNTLTQSSYLAYYYPDVYDLDGVLSPLDGYVAGKAASQQVRIDAEGGVKASVTGTLPITGVKQVGDRDPVRDADAELLYANSVNYVRFIRGTGYRLDSQLLSAQEGSISRVHHRMILSKLKYDIKEALVQFRDRTIDAGGNLQDDIQFALTQLLDQYQPGKIAPNGNTFFNAAVVVTDNSIQNAPDLEQGLLHVIVSGSLSPKSERISLLFNVLPVSIG
jgi:hypothetical protein